MVTSGFLTVATVVLPLLLLPPPSRDCRFERLGDPVVDQQALAKFETAVNDYVVLHRRLERAWPPLWFLSDPEQLEAVTREFRLMLRDARPLAAQGNVFTPEIADILRFRIRNLLREQNYDVAEIPFADDEESGADGWWTPVVNDSLPPGTFAAVWPFIEALPALPVELEYRLVGRDLVLLDVHSNMVVDLLDLAVPARVTAYREE